VISCRPRGIRTAFLDARTAAAPAAYPQVHHMTRSIQSHGDPATTAIWAGQAYPLPAAEPVAPPLAEACEAASRSADRLATGVAR
jgi:nitronate monooxygenase